ncbi:MAG TPA: rhomboid family intramembrane serine protease [Candidatus Dormibacteraeota bacterium]|nr:rhomboid family intramembrane serine protease [Candidatus Dormibacteraeota bacterium]
MDWSLVLLSQGIESTIERGEQNSTEGNGERRQRMAWSLLVSHEQFEFAVATLRQYQQENPPRPWQQQTIGPGLFFDWAAAAWVGLVLFFHWLNAHAPLEANAIMDRTAVQHGAWWRMFTAVWLHGDIGHLATNGTIGLVLLGLVMGHYGTGVGLLAAYLAGAGGNLAILLFATGQHRSLGASGLVMGALGLLAVQSLTTHDKWAVAGRLVIGGITGGFMLFLLLGTAPGTDVLAHLGGFVSGIGLGALLSWGRRGLRNQFANVIAVVLFIGLVVGPWLKVFRQP